MPTDHAGGESPAAAEARAAAAKRKKSDGQRQKRAEQALAKGRQPGQAGRPRATAQPAAENERPVATSCGSCATAGDEEEECWFCQKCRPDLITIEREHYLLLVELASRSLPNDLAWEFENVMTADEEPQTRGEVFRLLNSVDACRERYCPKRDVGDVPTEAAEEVVPAEEEEEEEAEGEGEEDFQLAWAVSLEQELCKRVAASREPWRRVPASTCHSLEVALAEAQLETEWQVEAKTLEERELQLAIKASRALVAAGRPGGGSSGAGSSAEHGQLGELEAELEAEFALDLRITRGDGEHSSGGRSPTAPAESSARKAARSSCVLPPSVQPSGRSPGLSPSQKKVVRRM